MGGHCKNRKATEKNREKQKKQRKIGGVDYGWALPTGLSSLGELVRWRPSNCALYHIKPFTHCSYTHNAMVSSGDEEGVDEGWVLPTRYCTLGITHLVLPTGY